MISSLLRPAAATWLVAMLLLVVSGWVLLPFPRRPPGWEEVVWTLGFGAGFTSVGAVLVDRRPGEAVSRITLGIGIAVVASVVLRALAVWLEARPGDIPPFAAVAALASQTLQTAVVVLSAPFLLVRFPSGREPGRLASVVDAIVVLLLLASALQLVRPGNLEVEWLGDVVNPLGIPALAGLGAAAGSLVVVPYGLVVVLAVAVVAVRYRRSDAIVRAQIRWVTVGAVLPVVLLVAGIVFEPLEWLWTASILATMLLPMSIGIAVLRYHLFEIDRIIGRTIAYAVVTAVLAAVFVGANVGLQAILAGATGNSTLTTAAATLLVAGLFQPLRQRVQTPIDRRFNRRRVDGERVVERVAARTRDHVDLELLARTVLAAVDETVAPAGSALWLRGRR